MAEVIVQIPAFIAKSHELATRELRGEVVKTSERGLFFEGVGSSRPSQRCLRCGQEITNPISRLVGYGPDCSDMVGIPRDLDEDTVEAARRVVGEQVKFSGWLPKSHTKVFDLDGNDAAMPAPTAPKKSKAKITVETRRVFVRSRYEMKDGLRNAGGRWDRRTARWHFPATPASAKAVIAALDGEDLDTDAEFDALLAQAQTVKEVAGNKTNDDLAEIPGSTVNSWMHQRQAYWFGKDLHALMLYMGMGCISGDTVLPVTYYTQGTSVTAKELFLRMRGEFPGQRKPWPDGQVWLRGRTADGRLGKSKLVAAFDHGVKPVMRVELSNGSVLRTTWDHEFVTPTGKVEAQKLEVGDPVFVQGEVGAGRRTDKDGYIRLFKTGHPRESTGGVYEHIIVAERKLGRPLEPGEVVHHRNGCKWDNTPANLSVLPSRSEHAGHHAAEAARRPDGTFLPDPYEMPDDRVTYERPGWVRFPLTTAQVVSVEPDGEDHVYDFTVAEHFHDYIAGGVLVGNSGKTKVTVDLLRNRGANNTLVLCPNSVQGVWPREIKKYETERGVDVFVFGREKGTVKKRVQLAAEAQRLAKARDHGFVCVINYEAAWRDDFAKWALSQQWDNVICDESHRIKSPTSRISKFAGKLVAHSDQRVALTGTPMSSGPLDVFGQFMFLDPGVFGRSLTRYRNKFCVMGGHGGHEILAYRILPTLPKTGRANPYYDENLAGEWNEKFYSLTYHVGDDVLDLPELHDVELQTTLSPKGMKVYKEITQDMYAEHEGEEFSAPNVLTRILRQQQITGGSMTSDTGETVEIDESKKLLLRELLESLAEDEPVVVFCRFTHDLRVVQEVTESLGRRYGELSGNRRDAITADAEMSESVTVAGVQIAAGGVGIDLTRARYGVYYSLGHSLIDYQQSRKRIHRPGQTRHTTLYHLVAKGTVDESVYKALSNKQEVVDYIRSMKDLG